MSFLRAAAFEMPPQPLTRWHPLLPAKPLLELFVRIVGPLPRGVPDSPVESRGQLALRPSCVYFPQIAEKVAEKRRNIHRWESFHLSFVHAQKTPARRQIVIDNVEHGPIDPLGDPGQKNGIRAIIDIGERHLVRSAQMLKDAKVS